MIFCERRGGKRRPKTLTVTSRRNCGKFSALSSIDHDLSSMATASSLALPPWDSILPQEASQRRASCLLSPLEQRKKREGNR
jgi:hypothetical protein